MKVCIPTEDNNTLDSRVCAHFGSAPFFLIVDTETNECDSIVNTGAHHAHGMCQPLALLDSKAIDGIVVGGIGRGALFKLQAAGIAVYMSECHTVRETIDAYVAGTLKTVGEDRACGGHGHGHGAGMGSHGPSCH